MHFHTSTNQKIVSVKKGVKSSHLLFILFSLSNCNYGSKVIELSNFKKSCVALMIYFEGQTSAFIPKDHEEWDIEVFQDKSKRSQMQKYI